MPPLHIVDLTSSPEPEESPSKILQQFQPRKQKVAVAALTNTRPLEAQSRTRNRQDVADHSSQHWAQPSRYIAKATVFRGVPRQPLPAVNLTHYEIPNWQDQSTSGAHSYLTTSHQAASNGLSNREQRYDPPATQQTWDEMSQGYRSRRARSPHPSWQLGLQMPTSPASQPPQFNLGDRSNNSVVGGSGLHVVRSGAANHDLPQLEAFTSKRHAEDTTSFRDFAQRKRPKVSGPSHSPRSSQSVEMQPRGPFPSTNSNPVRHAPARLDSPRESRRAVTSRVVTERVAPADARESSGSRKPYTDTEKALLKRLKEDENLTWDEICPYFPGRPRGSLQVLYSTKVKTRSRQSTGLAIRAIPTTEGPGARSRNRASRKSYREEIPEIDRGSERSRSLDLESISSRSEGRPTRSRRAVHTMEVEPEAAVEQTDERNQHELYDQDRAFPSSLARLLQQRELGETSRRAWSSQKSVNDELKNHAHAASEIVASYHGASGDVTTLSWSTDGKHFAAGSIAISDPQSQQYNMSRNLLLGNVGSRELWELPEHHISRPVVSQDGNVNALHSMRESQDKRLFLTVTATEFSAHSAWLYTAGADKMLRQYSLDRDTNNYRCGYSIPHRASVDVLTLCQENNRGADMVATAIHTADESINVYNCFEDRWEHCVAFSSSVQPGGTPLFPSALRFGHAPQHRHLLLAGFCPDKEKDVSGQTSLFDMISGVRLPIHAVTNNVFDIAWNPSPSSASVAFAVACNPMGVQVSKGTRSVIQCFAPRQEEFRRVLTWECPALDINDVVFCPHDDNLIAAGATNGCVYVWDQRSADRLQKPLHVLRHDESLNVLPSDRPRELTDTGVRFLAWGSTRERLYSGSSDGVVRVWNPGRTTENAHVKDLDAPQSQRSAIMSGAFNADYSELLVGTENGRINLYNFGCEDPGRTSLGEVMPFKLHAAQAPQNETANAPLRPAQELLESGQIVLRPCGAMPFRQAVQGPNYRGPFLAPSPAEMTAAEAQLQAALAVQHQVSTRHASLLAAIQTDLSVTVMDTDEDIEEHLIKADRGVRSARIRVEEQQRRLQDAKSLKPKAKAFQRSLLADEYSRQELLNSLPDKLTACTLDCKVLPIVSENDAVADDEPTRADVRIPGLLREIAALQSRRLADVDPPSVLRDREKSLRRKGLLAECARCARRARIPDDNGGAICERCQFACFRCAQPVEFSEPGGEQIACRSCDLEWHVGVLGYELVSPARRRPLWDGRAVWQEVKVADDAHDDNDECGEDTEVEHYMDLWGTDVEKDT